MVLVLTISIWQVLRNETLNTVVNSSFSAIETANGQRLLDTMAPKEASLYELSGDQWSEFLTKFVMPRMAKWKRGLTEVTTPPLMNDCLQKSVSYYQGNGSTAVLTFLAYRTEVGPRVSGGISNLLSCVAYMSYQPPANYPTNYGYTYCLRELVLNDRAELERLRLRGIVSGTNPSLQSWDDLLLQLDKSIRSYDKVLGTNNSNAQHSAFGQD